MGTFGFRTLEIHIISRVTNDPLVMEVPFKTSYLSDAWTLPSLNDETSIGIAMPLSTHRFPTNIFKNKLQSLNRNLLSPNKAINILYQSGLSSF